MMKLTKPHFLTMGLKMTKQSEIMHDNNYKAVLNEGFIGLVDVMGDDNAIEQAARVSYGEGTRKTSETRGLIRYLMRHWHSTPFEMVEFKFHCKMPIFVARQWIRHRTANVNEYSGRYSVMVDDFYVPEVKHILPQSDNNNQGRGGELDFQDQHAAQLLIEQCNERCYDKYQILLGQCEKNYTVIDGSDRRTFTADFEGIAREIARGVLSVNNYTEWYWKCDLHNIFHFLRLRSDDHAQYEIRVYAQAMAKFVKKHVPLAYEAFEDYRLEAENFSKQEMSVLEILLSNVDSDELSLLGEQEGLSKREIKELISKLKK
jgi:thymidylate synthase (FAD)